MEGRHPTTQNLSAETAGRGRIGHDGNRLIHSTTILKGYSHSGPPMTNVLMQTSEGDVTIEVFTEKMPVTAGNFLKLVEEGYYDGLHFHRVIKGFMIQGGCPNSRDPTSPRCGTGGPGYTISDEHPDDAQFTNDVGTLSMANTGRPNSGGSQFFINTNHNKFLDWWDRSSPSAHPVFAKVVEGMDIIKRIEATATGMQDRPLTPMQIISVKRV